MTQNQISWATGPADCGRPCKRAGERAGGRASERARKRVKFLRASGAARNRDQIKELRRSSACGNNEKCTHLRVFWSNVVEQVAEFVAFGCAFAKVGRYHTHFVVDREESMAEVGTFSCARGHHWGGDGTLKSPAVCPTCGLAAIPATLDHDSLDAPSQNSDSDATLPQAKSATEGSAIRPEVPGFIIERELGRGGMGVVYLARQKDLNRLVALKMILAGAHAGPRERERFRIEAQAAAQLQHANIVQIHEIGEAEGHPYLALEYVAGSSLAARLTGNPWPARDAARLIEPIALAIHHAHERGIIHRDLKPANVLLSTPGDSAGSQKADATKPGPESRLPMLVPKITDFGLAKQLNEVERREQGAGPTRSGAVMGTPSYIAPEQASGRGGLVGPAADVYSLGAILYEMLTGRPPFRGETQLDTLLQVMADDPIPPRQLQPKVPRDLETICLKCLQKETWRRYISAAELADDLRRFMDNEPIQARPVSAAHRMVKWARRKPALALLIAGASTAIVFAFVAMLVVNFKLNAAAERERKQAEEANTQKLLAQKETENAERLRSEAEAQKRKAEQETTLARRSLYALQLAQVAALSDRNPYQARQLLEDPKRCPPDLRDFTWGNLHRLCRRERPSLGGHFFTVSSVAFGPDGQWLASAGWDRTVRLWSPICGTSPLLTLNAHDGSVLALAVSADGSMLATASDDKTVKIWSIQRPLAPVGPGVAVLWPFPRLRERAVLPAHQGGVRAVAFSPDGATLATGYDTEIKLWDTKSFQELAALRGHSRVVWTLTFSRDGKILASGSEDQTIKLWDTSWLIAHERMPAEPLVDTLKGHTDGVVTLAFAPDGKTLASGGNDRDQTLRLWDMARRKERARLKGHTRAVFAVAFAPDGQTIATSSGDGSIRLWDPTSGRERTVLQGHLTQIHALAFSPDSRMLASGGADQMVRLWDLDEHREETIQVSATRLGPVRLSPDASKVIFGDDASLKIGDLPKGDASLLPGHQGPVMAIAAAGGTTAALDLSGTCRIWKDGKLMRTIPNMDGVRVLALSRDGSRLAVGGNRGFVRVCETASGDRLDEWPEAHAGPVTAVTFAPDGQTLASAGKDDRLVRIWEIAVKQPRQTLSGAGQEVRELAFAPNAAVLAGSNVLGSIALWRFDGTEPPAMLTGHTDVVTALAFTADGLTLASGSDDRTVKLWDAVTGQERATLAGHSDHVVSLAFNADATVLATAARDGAIKFWLADRR
jgi:WD40 repeat protein/serine/threonine protein kinase